MSGSPAAAMTRVPQYSPVQPPRRPQLPATSERPASAASVVGRRSGMPPKISPGPGRSKVGGGELRAPRGDDRGDDLIETHTPSEDGGQGRLSAHCSPLTAHPAHDLLRAVEQNGPMLQERVTFPHLRRADQLATGDEHFTAGGDRETRSRMMEEGGGWWRMEIGRAHV